MNSDRTIDGDMLDAICKAQSGREAMIVAVHEANPGLVPAIPSPPPAPRSPNQIPPGHR